MPAKIIASRIALCIALCTPAFAHAAISSLDLSNYRLTAIYALPSPLADEASALTWSWDDDTLYVVGDEGDGVPPGGNNPNHSIVQVSKTGELISSMLLRGFEDTEGLTYIGGGQFVVVEERLQDVYLLTYTPGGSVSRNDLPFVSIGPTVGNIGLEGISYDPTTERYIAVRESPQIVHDVALDFTTGIASGGTLPIPNPFALDLSDVQVLSTVTSPGSPDEQNLLVLSQESQLLMEVDRTTGSVLSFFSLAGLPNNIEGVTIDANGTIYLSGETPALYVLSPVPLPAAAWLMLSGIAGLIGMGARRRHAAA